MSKNKCSKCDKEAGYYPLPVDDKFLYCVHKDESTQNHYYFYNGSFNECEKGCHSCSYETTTRWLIVKTKKIIMKL